MPKNEEKALAPVQGTDWLQKRPEWVGKDAAGRENIQREDVTLPRLSIAQGLSPQMSRTDPKFIPGLQVGQLFNNLTGEIYGERVRFVPVRVDKRAMEFYPRENAQTGGPQGVKDKNVPWDDPRCEFHGDQKPQAERFYDYLGLLTKPSGAREVIVLSMNRTKIKVAKQLNGLISLTGNAPMFDAAYIIETAEETSKVGGFKFQNFKISPAGWATQEESAAGRALFEEMKGKTFEVEREQPDDFPEVPDPTKAPASGSREPGEDDV